jgi:hypothetical protein
MKMKPLPRLLLIVAAVGGAFYGINILMSKGGSAPYMSTQAQPSVSEPMQAAPAVQAPIAPVVAQPAPQSPQVDPALTPSTLTDGNASTNAGLSKLLNSGAKK